MMMMEQNKDIIYGAGEGYRSTGAVVGGEVGPGASLANDHGRLGVDCQAPLRVNATGSEDIEMEMDIELEMEVASAEETPPGEEKMAEANSERKKEKRVETERTVDRSGSSSRGGKAPSSPPASKAPGVSSSSSSPPPIDDSEIFRIPRKVGEKGKSREGARSGDNSREQSRSRRGSMSGARSENDESCGSRSTMASVTSRGKKRKIVMEIDRWSGQPGAGQRRHEVADGGA